MKYESFIYKRSLKILKNNKLIAFKKKVFDKNVKNLNFKR